jgi:protein-tyrosine phosphatase
MNINIMETNTLVDFHAHILPGMDHGCDDVAMSIKQLRMAAEHKIDIVIATSHFYPHQENVDSFLKRRQDAMERLQAIQENEHPIIRLGAEVLICNNIDKMQGIEDLCIEHSKVLLIEMPITKNWETNLLETILRLRDVNGLDVILAHGERYPKKEVEKLLEKGFQVQLNVSGIACISPSPFVKKCIKQQFVVALGSDIHGLSNNYNNFTKALKKLGPQAEKIMEKTCMFLGEK